MTRFRSRTRIAMHSLAILSLLTPVGMNMIVYATNNICQHSIHTDPQGRVAFPAVLGRMKISMSLKLEDIQDSGSWSCWRVKLEETKKICRTNGVRRKIGATASQEIPCFSIWG